MSDSLLTVVGPKNVSQLMLQVLVAFFWKLNKQPSDYDSQSNRNRAYTRNTLASRMCMGHSAVSTTSIAGKQPLFNLHQANLWGCSIHQGQLPAQSAGGYLRSPSLHALRHWPLALLWIRVLAARRHKRPHSGARNWVVWLFDTAQHGPWSHHTVSATTSLRDADFTSFGSNGWPSGAEYWWDRCQGRQSCEERRATA